MVIQRDVTERALLDGMMAELMQAQLGMLCKIFPRWGWLRETCLVNPNIRSLLAN